MAVPVFARAPRGPVCPCLAHLSAGLGVDDAGLFKVNEAFAGVPLIVGYLRVRR
jgi:hypothetical protein